MLDYSVIIRTTGKAGEKYRALLDSIYHLCPSPFEVIVVLPNGYEKPKEQLGYETFLFSPKGMVAQRLFGINACKTPYALICDDDVCFDSDFICKLARPIEDGKCNISAGPLLSFLPPKGIKGFISAICAAGVPTLLHKDRYCSVLPSSGYSFNRNINTKESQYIETESLPWTCFFADVNALKRIELDAEVWLDANGYAAMDDQTMFYKAKLRGIKTIVVTDAIYKHLDAQTSTSDEKKHLVSVYALEFNRYIFWHRFIYSLDSRAYRVWDILCYYYSLLMRRMLSYMNVIRNKENMSELKIRKQAFRDAKKYVTSDEYRSLPNVKDDEV